MSRLCVSENILCVYYYLLQVQHSAIDKGLLSHPVITYSLYVYFSQLLNVNSVSDVRQKETHTAESLVPGHISLEVEVAIVKL